MKVSLSGKLSKVKLFRLSSAFVFSKYFFFIILKIFQQKYLPRWSSVCVCIEVIIFCSSILLSLSLWSLCSVETLLFIFSCFDATR